MLNTNILMAVAGLAALGVVADSSRANAGTLGIAEFGVTAVLDGAYDVATGDVSGVGSVEVVYEFSLPTGPAIYSGSVTGGASFEIFDDVGAMTDAGVLRSISRSILSFLHWGTSRPRQILRRSSEPSGPCHRSAHWI